MQPEAKTMRKVSGATLQNLINNHLEKIDLIDASFSCFAIV
jgi:hypothetical protein